MLQSFRHHGADHRRLFGIALPMIISNIAAPLLGLVDTAIIGHLPDAIYLSSVAVGAMAINFIYLLAVFLRMSTTGVVAQAFGSKDNNLQRSYTVHGLAFAFSLGALILLLQPLILQLLWWLVEAEGPLQAYATEYVQIRFWGAPAALGVLVILGVLLGRQQARLAMLLVILTNATNVVLDVLLVIGLDMNVRGAAWASVGAEWLTLACGLWMLRHSLGLRTEHFRSLNASVSKNLLSLNSDIFIRSLVLQLCMAMMTAYASYIGATTVAANAVLLQFLMLISLGLDGIAYSAEALIGEAKGQQNRRRLRHWLYISAFWSVLFALLYSVIFLLAGSTIIRLITSIPAVIETAEIYLPWLIVLPLVAHWSYLFDGVFIGLSASKAMRNTMLLAAVFAFLPAWALTLSWGNHGLWFALCCFMLARGLWQWIWLVRYRLLHI